MGSHSNPEQVRADKIAAMGEDLRILHYELSSELVQLCAEWNEYSTLFAGAEESVDLLNKTAPRFFHHAQRMFENGIILHICRLTDPVSNGKKQNLTIMRLAGLIDNIELSTAVQAKADEAGAAAGFARDHRHRRIAHRDLLVARNQHSKPLEAATLVKFRSALESIAACLNVVQKHYEGCNSLYGVVEEQGGAKALLHYLGRGRKHLEEERKGWGLG